MIQTYKFLVITDHRVHKPSNPIYSLLPTLFSHNQCESINIVSRGNNHNSDFFEGLSTSFYCATVDSHFSFMENGEQFLQSAQQTNLDDYDVILMRLSRPVTANFLAFLAKEAADKIIINHPSGIEKTATKAFLLNFPAICPPMKLCYSIEEIVSFMDQFPIVLKPLKEYGGKGIVRIENGQINNGDQTIHALDFLKENEAYIKKDGYLAMKFLKNVGQGDKRIIVINGEIIAASLRLPPEGSWLCNVAQGGSSVPSEVDEDEQTIIAQISPKLIEEGILIFGADTLVDDDGKRVLSEINTLSVGGFADIEKQSGKPIVQITINKIIEYVNRKYKRGSSFH